MKTVYLLGSGFTRGIVGEDAPLNDDVMENISKPPFSLKLIWYKTRPNIELYLSYLDLKWRAVKSTKRKDKIRKYREKVIYEIRNRFDDKKLLVSDVNQYPDLDKFVRSIPACSYIITLNYDMVLDQGLWLNKVWHPSGGYHLSTFPAEEENSHYKNIKVIKPHGSVNFWVPYQEDEQNKQDNPYIELSEKYFMDSYSHINKRNESNEKPFLVPMTYIKVFRNGLMSLWREAIKEIEQAQKLVIIGCSIREEDSFLVYALHHFGMSSYNQKPEVDIVLKGKCACEDVKRKIKRTIAYPHTAIIKTYPDGFSSYV